MEIFTGYRIGRLIGPLAGEVTKEATHGDCAKRCANNQFNINNHCENLEQ
jgi:hypothetical protein